MKKDEKKTTKKKTAVAEDFENVQNPVVNIASSLTDLNLP